jgi:fatty-acyl-CoA synthase
VTAPAIRVVDVRRLRHRAERLSCALRWGLRIAPGDRVAVVAGARPEVFELLFACVGAGAALVPLDRRLADAELAERIADSEPALVVADDEQAGRVAALAPVLRLGRPYEDLLARTHGAAASPPVDDRPALILYTSGTTGRPKGAVLPWRQLAFNARATRWRLGLGPDDRALACLPLCHTGGLNCLATPVLWAGGEVVLMERFDPEAALDALARHRVTATIAVPAMLQMLLDAGPGAGLARRRLPHLRHVLCGGAPLPDAARAAWRAAGHPLAHGYGLTEVGPNCFTFGDADVGRPMPGTEARVGGPDGAALEPGDVGELSLRGPHVAAGYWRRPDETAAAFAGGWFRTGDLVRRDHAGRFAVVGRRKEMFISGGENVYPAEVERVLARHPAVAEVAVIGVPDRRWGEVGLAAVVARPGRAVDVGALRAWARAALAGFKIPRHWRVVQALPRGATFKVAKHEIAAAFAAEREAS